MTDIPYDTWANEAIKALATAEGLAKAAQGNTDDTLFKYAPLLAAKARGLKDREQIQQMGRQVAQERLSEFKLMPEVKQHRSLNFLLAYLQANMAMDLLDAEAVNGIMKYLIDHHDFD